MGSPLKRRPEALVSGPSLRFDGRDYDPEELGEMLGYLVNNGVEPQRLRRMGTVTIVKAYYRLGGPQLGAPIR